MRQRRIKVTVAGGKELRGELKIVRRGKENRRKERKKRGRRNEG